jgi:uncharacterized protein
MKPQRTCVGCRTVRPKDEMIRLARAGDGVVVVDREARAPGRGAYVCPRAECIERARRRLAGALRTDFDLAGIADELVGATR